MQLIQSLVSYVMSHGTDLVALAIAILVDIKAHFPSLAETGLYKAVNGTLAFLINMVRPQQSA